MKTKNTFKPLGILYYHDQVVNHRSICKVFLNPVLMMFGIMITSYFDNNKFLNYTIIRRKPSPNVFKNFHSHFFTCNDFDRVEKTKLL
jgi:hypothetical protein